MTYKPTVPEVIPWVLAHYAQPNASAGCCLHVVLDDANVRDETVQWCIDNARHSWCADFGRVLLAMSKTQRLKLYMMPKIGAAVLALRHEIEIVHD